MTNDETKSTIGRIAPEAYKRWVELALDAFRAPGVAREPLPDRPLRGDQVRRAMAQRGQPARQKG